MNPLIDPQVAPVTAPSLRPVGCRADPCQGQTFEARMRHELARYFRCHRLTWQEEALLTGAAAGLTNGEIARHSGWTEATVETYFKGLNSKLGIHTRRQACHCVIEELVRLLDERLPTDE